VVDDNLEAANYRTVPIHESLLCSSSDGFQVGTFQGGRCCVSVLGTKNEQTTSTGGADTKGGSSNSRVLALQDKSLAGGAPHTIHERLLLSA
jgi:hypothetical protein